MAIMAIGDSLDLALKRPLSSTALPKAAIPDRPTKLPPVGSSNVVFRSGTSAVSKR